MTGRCLSGLNLFLVESAEGNSLGLDVETEAVFAQSMQIVTKGVLVTDEWECSDGNRNTNVDTYRTAVNETCTLSGIVTALGIDYRAVYERIVVHEK